MPIQEEARPAVLKTIEARLGPSVSNLGTFLFDLGSTPRSLWLADGHGIRPVGKGDRPDAIFRVRDPETLVGLQTGQVTLPGTVLRGDIVIRGDVARAQQFARHVMLPKDGAS